MPLINTSYRATARKLMQSLRSEKIRASCFRVCGVRVAGVIYPIEDDENAKGCIKNREISKGKTLAIWGKATRETDGKTMLVSYDINPQDEPSGELVTWEVDGCHFSNVQKIKI